MVPYWLQIFFWKSKYFVLLDFPFAPNAILFNKGANAPIALKGGYVKAFLKLFPDIGLDETKFDSLPCMQTLINPI